MQSRYQINHGDALKAPFPYFGGKSRAASLVWQGLGSVKNYVEPFFGSGAVLLCRPDVPKTETINDADGLLANFWRALRFAPDEVAKHADWIIHECDLHARHSWLVGERERITAKLEGDPNWYDAKAAGWWVWGISLWIGSGWCSGRGAWIVKDGELINSRQLPHLGNAGQGIHRQLPHLGDAGQGIHRKDQELQEYFRALADRLCNVRICCGDWSRVLGPSVTVKHGLTGVFLDPPYADTATRAADLYAKDSLRVAHDVREWAIAHGDDPALRIVLAGYDGEHEMPDNWQCVAWHPRGGYDGQNKNNDNQNRTRERLWFSPHCLPVSGGQIVEIATARARRIVPATKHTTELPLFAALSEGAA